MGILRDSPVAEELAPFIQQIHELFTETQETAEAYAEGPTVAATGSEIGSSQSTIFRETSGNQLGLRTVKYTPHQAQAMARRRRKLAKQALPRKMKSRSLLRYGG